MATKRSCIDLTGDCDVMHMEKKKPRINWACVAFNGSCANVVCSFLVERQDKHALYECDRVREIRVLGARQLALAAIILQKGRDRFVREAYDNIVGLWNCRSGPFAFDYMNLCTHCNKTVVWLNTAFGDIKTPGTRFCGLDPELATICCGECAKSHPVQNTKGLMTFWDGCESIVDEKDLVEVPEDQFVLSILQSEDDQCYMLTGEEQSLFHSGDLKRSVFEMLCNRPILLK